MVVKLLAMREGVKVIMKVLVNSTVHYLWVILPFSRLQIVTVELFLIKFEYFIAPRLLVVNLLVQ